MMPRLACLLAFAIALAGCAGTPKQASANAGDYEYVTPVGSNIPVRVPKGQSATSATSPTGTISGEGANQMIRGAPGQAPVDRAGAR